jgi:uncharacterized membrane protein YecN with MAPEG domain
MNPIALICAAVLGLLLFGLGVSVSTMRFRARQGCGCEADPRNMLHKLVRAHGNTAEYAPFLYLGAHTPTTATVSLIVAATVCRCLLVIGLLAWPSMDRPNPLRFAGALGTYATGIALSLALLH